MSIIKYVVLLLYFHSFLPIIKAATYYLITERPVVQSVNPKIISHLNVTARRYGRRNPIYYTSIHGTILKPADDNVTIDVYFYEDVYNQYRLSLLEFHFKWCNLFLHDRFFGSDLRKALPPTCPHPAGSYHLYNLTLNADAIPDSFPFTKGRLLVNVTYSGEPVASAYADLELKRHKKLKI